MSFCISDEELDALYGLPHAAQLMYIIGIRPYMDYASGVVGSRRRISLRGLSESLYVDHVQGRNSYGAPTRQAIRSALQCLQSAGLIVPDGTAPMVFRLPYARVDNSAQNVNNTRTTHPQQGVSNTKERLNRAACDDVNNTRTTHQQQGVSNTPPVSDIRSLSSSELVIDSEVGAQNENQEVVATPAKPKRPSKTKSAKISSADYQPTRWALDQLSVQGIGENLWREVLSRFQHYYSAQAGKTAEQWDCRFVDWAVSDWKRQQMKSPTGTGTSVVGPHKGLSYEQQGQSYQRRNSSQYMARENITERQQRERELVDRQYAEWVVIDGGRTD